MKECDFVLKIVIMSLSTVNNNKKHNNNKELYIKK
jgi:hypothetical protein